VLLLANGASGVAPSNRERKLFQQVLTGLLADLAKKIARDKFMRERNSIPGTEWVPRGFLSEYWRNLSYDLAGETEGLGTFFRLAEKIGRIPAAPSLRFLDLA